MYLNKYIKKNISNKEKILSNDYILFDKNLKILDL